MRVLLAYRLARYYYRSGLTLRNSINNAWENSKWK